MYIVFVSMYMALPDEPETVKPSLHVPIYHVARHRHHYQCDRYEAYRLHATTTSATGTKPI